jgi:predicted site-specific integrase-resolvase
MLENEQRTASNRMMNDVEVAEVLNISPQTLRIMRMEGRSPVPYVRIGRSIRYIRETVFATLKAAEVER